MFRLVYFLNFLKSHFTKGNCTPFSLNANYSNLRLFLQFLITVNQNKQLLNDINFPKVPHLRHWKWDRCYTENSTFKYPDTLVAATRSQICTVCTPSDTFHFVLVSFQRCDAFKVRRPVAPDGRRAIKTCCRQKSATRWPIHAAYCSLMSSFQCRFTNPTIFT